MDNVKHNNHPTKIIPNKFPNVRCYPLFAEHRLAHMLAVANTLIIPPQNEAMNHYSNFRTGALKLDYSNSKKMTENSQFECIQLCQYGLSQNGATPLADVSTKRYSDFGGHVDAPLIKKPRIGTKHEPRRIPCKARGMPEDHNSENAYFEISFETMHGKILACSHRDCAMSGRRFRYCAVCALPVAKRNFMKRHAHGHFVSSKELMDADMKEGFTSTCSFISAPKVDNTISSQATLETTRHHRVVSYDNKADPLQAILEAATESGIVTPSLSYSAPLKVQLNDNESKWISLLHRRPELEDTISMSNWMEAVVKFSADLVPNEILSLTNSETFPTPVVTPELSSIAARSVKSIENLSLLRQTTFPEPAPWRAISPREPQEVSWDSTFEDIDFSHIFDI